MKERGLTYGKLEWTDETKSSVKFTETEKDNCEMCIVDDGTICWPYFGYKSDDEQKRREIYKSEGLSQNL